MPAPLRPTLALLVLALGCTEAQRPGSLAGPCRADDRCDDGLECARGVCVLPDAIADAAVDAPSDASAAIDAPPMPIDAGVDAPWDASLVPPDPPPPTRDTGPRLPPPPEGVHHAITGFDDATLDWERHRLFLSQGGAGTVEVLDLIGGVSGVVATGHRAEAMTFDPVRDEVLVTLATGLHYGAYYDPQEGYVASIDPASLEVREPIRIDLDPWDLVADGEGRVYVSGALGLRAASVDLDARIGDVVETWWVSGRPRLALHPAGDRIYGAELDRYELTRYDLEGGEILGGYGGPFDAAHRLCGDLRIDPSGRTIHTSCGDVYRATNVEETDMTWTGTIGIAWRDLAFRPTADRFYVVPAADDARAVLVFDVVSLEQIDTIPTEHRPLRVFAADEYFVILSDVLGGAPQTLVEVRSYDAP